MSARFVIEPLAKTHDRAAFADAIDERAAEFYAAFGFTPLISRPRTLYLPLAVAITLMEK